MIMRRVEMWGLKTVLRGVTGVALGTLSLGAAASAQTIPDDGFYKGKQIQFLTYSASGGSSDFYVRALARYWPDHIPGKPTMIAQNLPGGGGIRMSNFLYKIAPKDGTTIGALNQTLGLEQILGDGVEYDTSKFNWLGRVVSTSGLVMIYHTAPATTIEGLREKEVIFAAPGKASQAYMTPTLMRNLLGFKTRVVIGYKGSAEIYLAMERGEVHGRTGAIETIYASKPDWIEKGTIKMPMELTLEPTPSMPGVVSLSSLAPNKEAKEILDLVGSYTALGIAYAAPPDVPASRVETLRRSFDATIKDERFLDDVKKAKMELSAATGERLQAVAALFGGIDPALVERTKKALEW
jgi:tripartite-type tricarboxylate transporter receptor subunit TctC